MKDSELTAASDRVFHELTKRDRPYNLNDLLLNISPKIQKTLLQKTLDQLVSADRIYRKTYGKQTIYSAKHSQDQNDPGIDANLAKAQQVLAEKTAHQHSLQKTLKTLQHAKTVKDLEQSIQHLQELIARDQCVLNGPSVDRRETTKIQQDWTDMRAAAKQLKALFKQIWSAIQESHPNPTSLWKELGLQHASD